MGEAAVTGLNRDDFREFFALMHDGSPPFDWQERLLDHVMDTAHWPDQIVAPTGAGKTAVIDVHVFAQALSHATGLRPPRRLSLVVDRRVLVDDQHVYARGLAERLRTAQHAESEPLLLQTMAARLAAMHTRQNPDETDEMPSPLTVVRLRGGVPPARRWVDDPTAPAIICATPEMWGSRLLLRGYASSTQAWPREAGLLAIDSVVVVDEAHLARQLLCTARRVRQLIQAAPKPLGPGLQVVEATATPITATPTTASPTTATPTTGTTPGALLSSLGVGVADMTSPVLAARLTRPKPVSLLPIPGWASTASTHRRTTAQRIARAVDDLVPATRPTEPRTVGCFVNSVARAHDVSAALRELRNGGLSVVMVCGQVRPHDLERLHVRHPGLLSVGGSSTVDVLISTQSLEVGVDLDFVALVTDLAPAAALAQRAGRVNRRGLRDEGPIVVVVPDDDITPATRSGPYTGLDLATALAWVAGRASDPSGLAPQSLNQDPPPAQSPRRRLFQRPEIADSWLWARSSNDLAPLPQLDLWLSDSFDEDTTVGIVVRANLPTEPDHAAEVVRELAPMPYEVFPARVGAARELLGNWLDAPDDANPVPRADESLRPVALLVRGKTIEPLTARRAGPNQDAVLEPPLRSGDVIVVGADAPFFGPQDGNVFTPPVLIDDPSQQRGRPLPAGLADVLESPAELPQEEWSQREVGGVRLRIELQDDSNSTAALRRALSTDQDGEVPDDVLVRGVLCSWLADQGSLSVMQRSALQLLSTADPDARRSRVVVQRTPDLTGDGGFDAVRVLIADHRRATGDETVQTWTPHSRRVTLDSHQAAVADRAATIAGRLAVPQTLSAALREAGAHHDDGKADPRFQVRLGRPPSEPALLAKSRAGTSLEAHRRRDSKSGLPNGWRHEQLSVAMWTANGRPGPRSDATPGPVERDGLDEDLVARLIGTSHGHGRTGFPSAVSELVEDSTDPTVRQVAATLFDTGVWDELIETTHQRYGVWGCAYLEALLRAADNQVSREGS